MLVLETSRGNSEALMTYDKSPRLTWPSGGLHTRSSMVLATASYEIFLPSTFAFRPISFVQISGNIEFPLVNIRGKKDHSNIFTTLTYFCGLEKRRREEREIMRE